MKGARSAFVLLALVGAFVLPATLAWAHAAFISSQPEPGQELGTAPGVVTLMFTEPLNERLSRATVTDPTGRRFDGRAISEEEMQVPLSTNATGVYDVSWTTVSTIDGHTLRGAFRFGVGLNPGPGSEATTVTGPRGSDLLIAIARAAEYLALLVAVGMILFRRLAKGKEGLAWVRVRPRPVLAVALLSGIAVVMGEAFAAARSPSVGAVVNYLTTGLPGLARVSRIGLEALALFATVVEAPSLWLLVSGALGALAAAGHAAAIRPAWWGILVDAVHLVAAGLWAGGILTLATLRPPGGWRGKQGLSLLARFSPVALIAFLASVGFGIVQAFQELGGLGELFGSSYGRVLAVKAGLVALMVPLSLLAWRTRRALPSVEAAIAVTVVAAAALLAAYPLPPSRQSAAEASREAPGAASAFPEPGDLTLGGQAGQVLVGLSLRPGQPGLNEVFVYLLPIEGEAAAAALSASLSVGGTADALTTCGSTCRKATVELLGGERVDVQVAGPTGGTAMFLLPEIPAPDGASLVERLQRRMHDLSTYRIDETLNSGLGTVQANYAFVAPDSFESQVEGGPGTIWIGDTRYLQQQTGGAWQVERGASPSPIPSFIWDYFKPLIDPAVLGTQAIEGVRTTIVAFVGESGEIPVWFKLWVDGDGLVRQAQMRAPGHFMDHRYFDFDAPITINSPVLPGPP